MITNEADLAVIEEWPELATVLFNEGIDTDAMTEEEQRTAIEVWNKDRTRFLDPDLAGKEMDDRKTLILLLRHFGRTHGRSIPVFCPICGSKDLYETCPSMTYYTVRAIHRGESIETIADRQESKAPSVGEPDLFRCEQCDFETESEEALLRYALIGGEIEGKVVIQNGVRVELVDKVTEDSNPRSLVEVHFHYPESPAAWVKVTSGESDVLTVPVAMDGKLLRKEVVMRRAADAVKERLVELERSQAGFAGIYNGWRINIGTFQQIEIELIGDEYLAEFGR